MDIYSKYGDGSLGTRKSTIDPYALEANTQAAQHPWLKAVGLTPTAEELMPSGLSYSDLAARAAKDVLLPPLATIGSMPSYLSGAAQKLYHAYKPDASLEERQQAIANVPNAANTYDSIIKAMGGLSEPQPGMVSNSGIDAAKTIGDLATGAIGFTGDVIQGFGTQLNPALFGEKALNKLTPEEEAYLRSIPSGPISQAFAIDYSKQPGPVQGTVQDVFGKISELGKEYVADPVAKMSGDTGLGEFASNIAMLGAFEVGGKGVAKGKELLAKRGKGVVEVLDPVAEAAKAAEMEKAAGADTASASPEVAPVKYTQSGRPIPEPVKVISEFDSKLALLDMNKNSLLEELSTEKKAQRKRRINEQIAEIDKTVAKMEFDKGQSDLFGPVTEELGKFNEAAKLEESKQATRNAWADKRAREIAEQSGLQLKEQEAMSGPTPETLGTPPEPVNVWESLKGEVPKETPVVTDSVSVGETPFTELQKLNNEMRAKEAGYPDHAAYLEDLKMQERISGEGPHGSIVRGPVTSGTIELAQVTGKNTDVQAPRRKGVSYEVAISPEGQRSVVKVNFDPAKISPEEVSAFKEKFGGEATTLRKGTQETSSQIADGTEANRRTIKEDRFTPAEETLRDNLSDVEERTYDLKDQLKDQFIAEDPKLAEPERLPDLIRKLDETPEYAAAKVELQRAQQLLDEHLGVAHGSPEAEMAAILAKQPKAPVSRPLTAILGDIKEVASMNFLKGEEGMVGNREMSPATKAALDRLKDDARAAGRTLEDHLKELKMPSSTIHMFTGREANPGGTKVRSEADVKKALPLDDIANSTKEYKGKDGTTTLIANEPFPAKDAISLLETKNITKGVLTNPIYFFEHAGSFLKERVWDYYNSQKHQNIQNLKGWEEVVKKYKKEYTRAENKEAYYYAVARRAGGSPRLFESGIKIPENVSARVIELANRIEGDFKSLFERLNEMRTKNGLSPIDKVQNYVTFFGDAAEMSAWHGYDVFVEGDIMNKMKEFNSTHDTSFRYGKRAGNKGTIDPNMNITTALMKYAHTAEYHINIQPVVSRIKTYLGEYKVNPLTGAKTKNAWSFTRTHPKAAEYLAKFAKDMSRGYKDRGALSQNAAKNIQKFQRNFSSGMITYNVNTLLSQPSSILTIPAAVGVKGLVRGLGILNPRNMRIAEAAAKSFDLRSFMHELHSIADIVADKGMVSGGVQFVNELGTKAIGAVDRAMSYYAWWAGYTDALARGLSKEKAGIFADDVTFKTQASSDFMHGAPIQRTVLGGAATTLMTYKISLANFIIQEVIANPNISKVEVVKRAVVIAGSMMAINAAYDALGLKSPQPEPEKKYQELLDTGMTETEAGVETALSTMGELVLGSSSFGVKTPIQSVLENLVIPAKGPGQLEDKYRRLAINVGALAGVPAVNAIGRATNPKNDDLKSKFVPLPR